MTVKTYFSKYIYISNKCCCFKFNIHYRILKKIGQFPQKILSNTTDNKKCSLSSIRLISERSRDTEDRSNDAENTALHHKNTFDFKIY